MSDLQTLKEIRTALAYVQKKKRDFKRHKKAKRLYSQVNRKYKDIDWSKDKIISYEANDILSGKSYIYKRHGLLKRHADCNNKFIHTTKNTYYKKSDVEKIFLVQELKCSMDDDFWKNTKNVKWKPEYIPFYFNSAYIGNVWICSYPKSLSWKAELLTEYLHSKEYLFDESSPFFRGRTKTYKFIEKNLMHGKVDKWDYYLQRFLSEK